MEDVGRIWADIWKNKYNLPRRIKLNDEAGNEYMEDFLGTDYKDSPIDLKIDIGPSTTYSEFNAQGTLDRLYDRGAIDTSLYLKYSSKTSVPFKDSLLKELENIANVQVPPMEMGQGGDYMTPDMEMTQM